MFAFNRKSFNRKTDLTDQQKKSFHYLTGSEFVDYPKWADKHKPIEYYLN